MENENSLMQDDRNSVLHIANSAIQLGRLQSPGSVMLNAGNSDKHYQRSVTSSESSEMHLGSSSTYPATTPGAFNMHHGVINMQNRPMPFQNEAMHPKASSEYSADLSMRSVNSTMTIGSSLFYRESSAFNPRMSVHCENLTVEQGKSSKYDENSTVQSVNVSENHGCTRNGSIEMQQESSAMFFGNSSHLFGTSDKNIGASIIEKYPNMLNKCSYTFIESIDERQHEDFDKGFTEQTEDSDMGSNIMSDSSKIPASQIENEMLHQTHEISEIYPLEKFSDLPHTLKKEYSLTPGCNLKWNIELMIQKNTRRDNCFDLQVKLIRNGKGKDTLRTNLRIALTDSNNQVLYDYVFSSLSSTEYLGSTSFVTMILDEKNIYPLANDKLNVCLVLEVKDCCLENDIPEEIDDDNSFNKMLLNYQNDLRTAYENKLLNDFCLVVGMETFEVNKFVLCARSPVFNKLFGLGTQPHTFYRLNPACKTKKVMDAFLLYLYTGIINDLDMDTACGLYIVAKEFHIMALLLSCGHIMLSKLNPGNACKMLILMHHNRDLFLKDAALQYIKNHVIEVELTKDWQFLSRNLPILKSEIQTFFSEIQTIYI